MVSKGLPLSFKKFFFFTQTHRMYMYTYLCKRTHTHVQRGAEHVGGLTATREVLTNNHDCVSGW